MDEKTTYLVTFNHPYWDMGADTYTMKLTEGEKNLIEWLDEKGYFDRVNVSISTVIEEIIEF